MHLPGARCNAILRGMIHPSSRPAVFIIIATAAFMLGLLVLTAALSSPSPFSEQLRPVGPDSFMRLLRIEAWWQSGDWYDAMSRRSNAPYGEVLHWTRPFDLLVLAPTLVFNLVLPFRDALLISAVIVGPLLGLGLLGLLSWGNRGRRPVGAGMLLAVLIISVPQLRGSFIPMRVDHHSLLLVCFVAMLVALLRMSDNIPARNRLAWLAGLAAGLALWTSVEALITVLIGVAALGLLWFAHGDAWLGQIWRFLWGTVAVLAVGLLLERPLADALTVVTYDQPSVVHLCALGTAALAWWLLAGWRRRLGGGRRGRWLVALLGVGIPFGIQATLFPDFFQSPFGASMDPRLDAIWLSQISELQPLVKANARAGAKAAVLIGPGVIALIWAIMAWRTGEPSARHRALVLLVALAVTLPLALYQVRWSSYLGAVSVLPWLWAMRYGWQHAGTVRLWARSIPLRAPAFVAVYAAPFVLGISVLGFVDSENERPPATPCPWERVAPALARLSPAPLTIISFTHQGPEILWRTPHHVVATPYHRNSAGIRDSHIFFSTEDPEMARAIAARRAIDLVIVCRDSVEARIFARQQNAFIHRLLGQAPPDWLVPEPLAGGEGFRILRVK